MADSLTTIINLLVKPQLVTPFATLAPAFSFAPVPLTNGVGLNMADIAYIAQRTATTTPDNIDLRGGGLIGINGAAFDPVKIVGVGLYNTSATAAEIITAGGGTNGWNTWLNGTTGVKIGPGGLFLNINPSLAAWGVTAATADLFPVVAAAGSPVYNLIFLGRSA